MNKLLDRINTYPSTARLSICFPGGEDIYPLSELLELVRPSSQVRQMDMTSLPRAYDIEDLPNE